MNLNCLILVLITLSSCCSNKKNTADLSISKINICPTDGKCSIEIFKNKSILINSDFGKTNYSIVDDFEKDVIRYQYSKNLDKSDVDGGYREEIVFEINQDQTDKKFMNTEIQQTKMLFGRYCFCRGQTGLYDVVNGSLNIKNIDNLDFELDFKISEVPQIINHIVVTNGKL